MQHNPEHIRQATQAFEDATTRYIIDFNAVASDLERSQEHAYQRAVDFAAEDPVRFNAVHQIVQHELEHLPESTRHEVERLFIALQMTEARVQWRQSMTESHDNTNS